MSKYIDAEKLIAELTIYEDTAIDAYNPLGEDADFWHGKVVACEDLKNAITSLDQEQPNNMIQWNGSNLKEVIDFTGKSPRFEEWFKSWEEFETYVHQHNDILKLFCEDGSHYEVPVGAWIVKTPDGYNLPSVAKYVQQEQPGAPNKLIDGDAVRDDFVREIYRILDADPTNDRANAIIDAFDSLPTISYEQPEVDLEKEVDATMKRYLYHITCREEQISFARHFYELGKARKEE